MHEYTLIDIVEVYDFIENVKFSQFVVPTDGRLVGHNYILSCMNCDKTRIVKEETFEKMNKLGLIK